MPPNTNQFEANGVTYTFEEGLSIDRYRMFERFRLEVGFGISTPELTNVLKQNIDFMERIVQGEKLFTQMVTLNYNALKGVTDGAKKEPFVVWLCTLFFNTADEDRRWFKDEVMREKIKNWQEAGIDNGFFISRACGMISNFNKIYDEITQMNLVWEHGETDEAAPAEPGPDQPTEIKTLDTRLRERNEYWTRLLTAMGNGDPNAYKTLQATDVIEFYYLYRAHQERIERLNSRYPKK